MKDGPTAPGGAEGGGELDSKLDQALARAFALAAASRQQPAQDGLPGSPQIGGRYALEEMISQGGMGIVYAVRDGDLRRQVALKTIREPGGKAAPHAGTPRSATERFLQEARITAQLSHPGIVPVHDLGFDAAGRPYFIMDRVRGRTLADVFRELGAGDGGWSLSRVVGILVKVCQAVAYAHSKSVVHRDLKPTNVMVGKYGEVYVMDWGLARILGGIESQDPSPPASRAPAHSHADATQTQGIEAGDDVPLPTIAGTVIGTPAYMAPEQARGAAAEIDQRSDVYSLGAILYQLLAGAPPYFEAGSAKSSREVLASLLAGAPRPLLELAPRAPSELVAICEKAMRRECEERYRSSLELAEDLQAYLDNRVVQAHRTGAVAEARAWVRRNRGMALAGVASLFLLLAAAIAVILLQERHRETLRRQLYSNDLSRVVAAFERRERKELREALDACPEDSRGWEWRWLERLADRVSRELRGHQPGLRILGLAVHPRGQLLASAGEDGSLRLWEPATGASRSILWSHSSPVRCAAFSRDGALLAAGSQDGLLRYFSAETGQSLREVREDGAVLSIRMHPDGERLATASLPGKIAMRRIATGEVLQAFTADGTRIADFSISGDGSLLAAASESGKLRIWDLASSKLVQEGDVHAVSVSFAPWPDASRLWVGRSGTLHQMDVKSGLQSEVIALNKGSVASLSWSADGRTLALTDGPTRVIDVQTGQVALVMKMQDAPFTCTAIDPLGSFVASGDPMGVIHLWSIAPDLGQRSLVDPQRRRKWGVALHPRETYVAACTWDGAALVWRAGDGALTATLTGHKGDVRSLRFSPTGDRLVTAGFDGTVRVWDVASGRELLRFAEHTGPPNEAAFSPDGSWIASASYDKTVKIWDAASGRTLRTLTGHEGYVWWLDISADGRRLISGGADTYILVWDTGTGASIARLSGHTGRIDSLEFSPDGKTIGSSSWDGTLKLWDASTFACLRTLHGHSGYISAFAFTADGSRILSVADDGKMKVWETESGRELVSFPCPRDTIDLASSTSGDLVVMVTKSGAVSLWDTAPGAPPAIPPAPPGARPREEGVRRHRRRQR